jgi:hypothetical protein
MFLFVSLLYRQFVRTVDDLNENSTSIIESYHIRKERESNIRRRGRRDPFPVAYAMVPDASFRRYSSHSKSLAIVCALSLFVADSAYHHK